MYLAGSKEYMGSSIVACSRVSTQKNHWIKLPIDVTKEERFGKIHLNSVLELQKIEEKKLLKLSEKTKHIYEDIVDDLISQNSL